MNKYLQYIGIEFIDGRASSAPKVYSLQGLFGKREKDYWENSAKRNHLKMRKSLFTPLDVVAGTKGGKRIGRRRITRGLLQNGTLFELKDDWTLPSQAHFELPSPWVGTTYFLDDDETDSAKSLSSTTLDSTNADAPPSAKWRRELVFAGLDLAEKRIQRFFDQKRISDKRTSTEL